MNIVRLSVRVGLWASLILALAGSLSHVAWGFSTLHGGDMRMGYVQAIAVDLGLAALTVGIQIRRSAGRKTAGLWAGVFLFCVISVYANLLHGFSKIETVVLTGAPAWLENLRPWLLSAVLPIMVVYLSEVVSEDERAAAEAGQSGQSIERTDSTEINENRAPGKAITLAKDDAKLLALALLKTDPGLSQREIAARIGKAPSTIAEYVDELRAEGRLNGTHSGVHA